MTATKRRYVEKLYCSKETKDKVITECAEILRDKKPDLAGLNLSQGFILEYIIDDWLENERDDFA